MSDDATQSAKVTVEAVAIRLQPCSECAADADGWQTATRNPNGYRHSCPHCAAMPHIYERIET